MADIFEQVDFIICATNPDVAFGAQGPMPTTIDGRDLISELGFEAALGNNGALTIPANTTGHPAVAIPAGTVGGLPVSMQIIGRRHSEQLLLDLARRRRARAAVAAGRAGCTRLGRFDELSSVHILHLDRNKPHYFRPTLWISVRESPAWRRDMAAWTSMDLIPRWIAW